MISLDPYLSSLWMLTLIPVDSQKGKGVWLDPFDEWRPGGKYDTFKRAGLLPRRWSLNMTHREQCCPPLCFIQTPQFWQRKAFFSCASWKKHLCRGKFFFLSSSLCMLDDSMQPMLQSATRTSVISHRDLKEQSDLFSFLYLMAEEANSSLATRCIGTAKECRSVKWLWNETTAWSQLGHPDILETALCPGCHVFCPLIISSCSSLIAERELESWFSVKRLPLFICCFFLPLFRAEGDERGRAVIGWGWILSKFMHIPAIVPRSHFLFMCHSSTHSWKQHHLTVCRICSDIIPTDVRQKRRQYIWLRVTYSPTQSHRTQQNVLDESQQQAHCLACKGAQVHRWEPQGLSAASWHRCHTEVHHRPPLPPPPLLPTPCPHLSPRIEVN